MPFNQLIDELNNKTTKTICECTLKTVIQKYDKFASFLTEYEQKKFENQTLSFQFAFVCYTLNLKLKDKSKQKKSNQPQEHKHLSL